MATMLDTPERNVSEISDLEFTEKKIPSEQQFLCVKMPYSCKRSEEKGQTASNW